MALCGWCDIPPLHNTCQQTILTVYFSDNSDNCVCKYRPMLNMYTTRNWTLNTFGLFITIAKIRQIKHRIITQSHSLDLSVTFIRITSIFARFELTRFNSSPSLFPNQSETITFCLRIGGFISNGVVKLQLAGGFKRCPQR